MSSNKYRQKQFKLLMQIAQLITKIFLLFACNKTYIAVYISREKASYYFFINLRNTFDVCLRSPLNNTQKCVQFAN